MIVQGERHLPEVVLQALGFQLKNGSSFDFSVAEESQWEDGN